MNAKALAASVALVGATPFSGFASAMPMFTGQIGPLGAADGPSASGLVCSTPTCTVSTWTGLDFGMFNIYLNTSGTIASLAGPGGLVMMQDPVSFASPGRLFTAGNLRFDWTTLSVTSDGATWARPSPGR